MGRWAPGADVRPSSSATPTGSGRSRSLDVPYGTCPTSSRSPRRCGGRAEQVITGRTRATDLAGIDAWTGEALRNRTVAPMLSVRTLAGAIGSPSRKTAAAVIDRLVNRWGLLARAPVEGGARAHAYRPSASAVSGTDAAPEGRRTAGKSVSLTAQLQVRGMIGAPSPGDDVWRHRDLGRSARLVYDQLDDLQVTVAELVAAGVVTRRTAYRCLRGLERRGLAVRVGDGWVRGSTTPAEAGAVGKCAGHGARDRARFADERRVYLNDLADLLDLTRAADDAWVTTEGEKVTLGDLWGVDWHRVRVSDEARERFRARVEQRRRDRERMVSSARQALAA